MDCSEKEENSLNFPIIAYHLIHWRKFLSTTYAQIIRKAKLYWFRRDSCWNQIVITHAECQGRICHIHIQKITYFHSRYLYENQSAVDLSNTITLWKSTFWMVVNVRNIRCLELLDMITIKEKSPPHKENRVSKTRFPQWYFINTLMGKDILKKPDCCLTYITSQGIWCFLQLLS